jgi:MSHA biogenesis protein MshJ
MSEAMKRLKARFETLSRRERIIVTIAAWLAVLLVVDTLALSPARQRGTLLNKSISEKEVEVGRLEAELTGLRASLAEDPDAPLKRRIAELEKLISGIDGKLMAARSRIVPPEKMTELIEQILRHNRQLGLVSLNSIPPEALVREDPAVDAKANVPDAGAGVLYRHGMELTLGGNYLDMLDYVSQLEQLPWKMYWGRLELKVDEYPRAILRLRVYTLSMDKAWLSI